MGKYKILVGGGGGGGGGGKKINYPWSKGGGGPHIFCQAYGDIRILLSVIKVNLCVREWGCTPLPPPPPPHPKTLADKKDIFIDLPSEQLIIL